MAAPKKSGIYKITSPTGRIYIGQSVDCEIRFAKYRKMNCVGQRRLYASFMAHGVDAHKFEVVEIVTEIEKLNERERFYQELHDVLGRSGLNCKFTTTATRQGHHSAETKLKISLSSKGRKPSKGAMDALRGRAVSQETRNKLSIAPGQKRSDKWKAANSKRLLGNSYCVGRPPHNRRKVVCSESGIIYESIIAASKAIGIKRTTLQYMVSGEHANRTTLRYL